MRLLRTKDYRLFNYSDKYVPQYAILSHRWDVEEVSFRNMQDAGMVSEARHEAEDPRKDAKLREKYPAVYQIEAYHQEKLFAMKDTCCIDKSSSAELQEAINTMYEWYKDAEVCLVYMNDVSSVSGATQPLPLNQQFVTSDWFRRGWTLQELLAPEWGCMTFFDREWQRIGNDVSLAKLIEEAANMEDIFVDADAARKHEWKAEAVQKSSIARRMSWAARRSTTRAEDQAYSLLGLFGVNMPLLYGEGPVRAFLRLQEAIMKIDTDESIFAWYGRSTVMGGLNPVLADSPLSFRESAAIQPQQSVGNRRKPFVWTPHGLTMDLALQRVEERYRSILVPNFAWRAKETGKMGSLYLAALDCVSTTRDVRMLLFLVDRFDYFDRIGDPILLDVQREKIFHGYGISTNVYEWQRRTIYGRIPGMKLGKNVNFA